MALLGLHVGDILVVVLTETLVIDCRARRGILGGVVVLGALVVSVHAALLVGVARIYPILSRQTSA